MLGSGCLQVSLFIDLQGYGYDLFKPRWWPSGRDVLVRTLGEDDIDWFKRCRSSSGNKLGGAFRSRGASSCAPRAPTLAVTWASRAEVACQEVRECVFLVGDE